MLPLTTKLCKFSEESRARIYCFLNRLNRNVITLLFLVVFFPNKPTPITPSSSLLKILNTKGGILFLENTNQKMLLSPAIDDVQQN